jgi:hypothetical protein
MPDRNRRILVWVLALAAVLLIGYAGVTVVLIARGELEIGPFRVLTVAANFVAGGLAAGAALVYARQGPGR